MVELDRILCRVERGSVKCGKDLFPLVSLCDVVARGLLLCCEEEVAGGCAGGAASSSSAAGAGGGRYDKSLVVLRGHFWRARQVVAPLCDKGRVAKLAWQHVRRNYEAVRDAESGFATQHKPGLATRQRLAKMNFGRETPCRYQTRDTWKVKEGGRGVGYSTTGY